MLKIVQIMSKKLVMKIVTCNSTSPNQVYCQMLSLICHWGDNCCNKGFLLCTGEGEGARRSGEDPFTTPCMVFQHCSKKTRGRVAGSGRVPAASCQVKPSVE